MFISKSEVFSTDEYSVICHSFVLQDIMKLLSSPAGEHRFSPAGRLLYTTAMICQADLLLAAPPAGSQLQDGSLAGVKELYCTAQALLLDQVKGH